MSNIYELVKHCQAALDNVDLLNERLRPVLEIISPKLFCNVRSYCTSDAEAEDLVQDALIKIALQIDRFKGTTDREFFGWCSKIAQRTAIDWKRAAAQRRITILSPEEIQEMGERGPLISWDTMRSVTVNELLAIIEKLGDRCRDLVVMYFFRGMTFSEIGDFLGEKEDAIRMALSRCVQQARKILLNERLPSR